jgi:hypothetical protein
MPSAGIEFGARSRKYRSDSSIIDSRLPMGDSPGHSRRASVSLITAT